VIPEDRTRKPTSTARPTSTPIIPEDRTRKPTNTIRPTSTPIVPDDRTRKPTSTERPTRTPGSDEERTHKPTSTARPTRTPLPEAPPPDFQAGGISASCRAIDKGGPADKDNLIHVTLIVSNDSGAEITGLTANALDVQGGAFSINSAPSLSRTLVDGGTAAFRYSLASDASLTISASASATGPGGELISIGPVSCEF
jgi:hypothetical protein